MTDKQAETSGVSSTAMASREGTGPLVSKQGRTSISDAVVAKIAGISAREISGVYSLGGGTARAVGAIRERIPGSRTNQRQGVGVEVGERQAAIDIDIVAEYGVSIADLATGVRRNVIAAIERMTSLEVVEVNVSVNDVHLDEEDGDSNGGGGEEPRVQ